MPGDILIGIGNPLRCDDAVGLVVARHLRALLPERIATFECRGEATELMARWAGVRKAVIVDAFDGGRRPGDIVRFDVARKGLPAALKQTSTHAFGLAEAVELSRALEELPVEFVVYGVQGQNFRPGETLSEAVAAAVIACCRSILAEFDQPSS